MRGKARSKCTKTTGYRITPAYAGKSGMPAASGTVAKDHPRVCGEKPVFANLGEQAVGSPPRMRGKVQDETQQGLWTGITPAYAGKSDLRRADLLWSWDHPRVCGEKRSIFINTKYGIGSPPRMRGKARSFHPLLTILRITPAYAGKSIGLAVVRVEHRDHPRVCGEKGQIVCHVRIQMGSPPRMRGKAHLPSFCANSLRITPAYAGKSPEGRLALT